MVKIKSEKVRVYTGLTCIEGKTWAVVSSDLKRFIGGFITAEKAISYLKRVYGKNKDFAVLVVDNSEINEQPVASKEIKAIMEKQEKMIQFSNMLRF